MIRLALLSLLSASAAVTLTGISIVQAADDPAAAPSTQTQLDTRTLIPLGLFVATLLTSIGCTWKLAVIWRKMIERVEDLESQLRHVHDRCPLAPRVELLERLLAAQTGPP